HRGQLGRLGQLRHDLGERADQLGLQVRRRLCVVDRRPQLGPLQVQQGAFVFGLRPRLGERQLPVQLQLFQLVLGEESQPARLGLRLGARPASHALCACPPRPRRVPCPPSPAPLRGPSRPPRGRVRLALPPPPGVPPLPPPLPLRAAPSPTWPPMSRSTRFT